MKNNSLLDLRSIVRPTAIPLFWYVPWRDVHLPCRFWHKLFSDIKRILPFFQFSVLNLLTTSSVNVTKSAVSCEISRRRVPYINKCAYWYEDVLERPSNFTWIKLLFKSCLLIFVFLVCFLFHSAFYWLWNSKDNFKEYFHACLPYIASFKNFLRHKT